MHLNETEIQTEEKEKYKVLLVDDEQDNLSLLYRTLRRDFTIFKTISPLEGLKIVEENDIDLIISDHKMEEMDGVEFLKRTCNIRPGCIKLLVTAYSDSQILIDAINNGNIYKYIKKPWEPSELQIAVNTALEYYKLKNENDKLIYDLKDLFSGTINAIMDALEAKNPYSVGQNKKIVFCAKKLAEELNLPHQEYGKIELAGLLHDIGTIGVPEQILNKPEEQLTEEEIALYQKHVEHGVKILKDLKQLNEVVEIIKYHHENYDGTGYPYGLKGNEIPLISSMISICNMYENLTSDSASKKGLSHEEAISKIEAEAEKMFSKELVEAFKNSMNKAKDEYFALEI